MKLLLSFISSVAQGLRSRLSPMAMRTVSNPWCAAPVDERRIHGDVPVVGDEQVAPSF